MKYLYIFLFAVVICSCNRTKYVEIDGNLPGVNNGAFAIRDQAGNQLLSGLISDGKFHVKNILQMQGFFDLFITPDIEHGTNKKLYEIYIEGTNYSITADKDKLYLYPVIKTDSKIQNQLSDFYSLSFKQAHDISRQKDSINDMLYGQNTPVVIKSPEYYNLLKQLDEVKDNGDLIQAKTLDQYIAANPHNQVEAFVLSQINYKKHPKDYYSVYQKFTSEQKNTPEGKQEGDELSQLAK